MGGMFLNRPADIQRLTGKTIFYRGLDYVLREKIVYLGYSEDGCNVEAWVRGKEDRGYLVCLTWNPEDGKYIRGRCSCPYRWNYCKHLAAVLIILVGKKLEREETGFVPGFLRYIPYQDSPNIISPNPQPVLQLDSDLGSSDIVSGKLKFRYLETDISSSYPMRFMVQEKDGDEIKLILRDSEQEKECIRRLLLAGKYSERCDVFVFNGKEFLHETAFSLLNQGFLLYAKSDKGIKPVRRFREWHIELSSNIDWLELNITIDTVPIDWKKDEMDPWADTGDEIILLDTDTLQTIQRIQRHGENHGQGLQVPSMDISLLDDAEPYIRDRNDPGIIRLREARDRLLLLRKRKSCLPKRIQAVMRPYQLEGYEWLDFLSECGFGGILADDMGLGKTLQALSLMAKLTEQGRKGPYIVAAPVSTLANWISEVKKFLPSVDVTLHWGSGRKRKLEEMPESGILLTSYTTMLRDIDLLKSIVWTLTVFDESQALKNYRTKTHGAARSLKSELSVALSGTPVENHLVELWAIMDIINPGFLGSRSNFKRKYITRPQEEEREGEALEELQRKVRPFILRRKKSDVAKDLPEKEEIRYLTVMNPHQEKYYRKQFLEGRERVERLLYGAEPWLALPELLSTLTLLRQTAIDSSLTGGPAESGKLDILERMVEEAVDSGNKVLIFSQFVKVLGKIEERIMRKSWFYAYLDGSTRNRTAEIRRFQEDPECRLFLISLKAGGLGINLTAADYVFIVDPWWNPAVEAQAIDRSHRIGRTKKVIAYKLIAKNTIEEKIIKLQDQKREVTESIFSDPGSVLRSLTPEEILELLS